MKYTLNINEEGCWINDTLINNKVFNKEMVEYIIEDRKDLIDRLIDWISEATTDKEIMKIDLRMLMERDQPYLFSSISTNEYVFENDTEYNNICEEILAKSEEEVKKLK